jgi:hypothetical protein
MAPTCYPTEASKLYTLRPHRVDRMMTKLNHCQKSFMLYSSVLIGIVNPQ